MESRSGVGSRFEVALPVTYGRAAGDQPEAPGALRVLVVDDDEAFRYLMRQLIGTGRGHVVDEAADGAQGLRLALERPPDVVVLDLQMPGMDGFEVLAELARHDATRDVPVVVATSMAMDSGLQLRLRRAHRVLAKDALSRELVDAVLQEIGLAGG